MGDLPVIKIYPPGTHVEVDGDALFLGRDCHLAAMISCLLNKVVSNRHCVIRREGDRWMLEDLGSTNGTWIHGGRLAGKTLLHTGDEFTLGTRGPLVECWKGFGGTGSDRTLPEDELPSPDAATVIQSPAPPRPEPPQPHDGKRVDERDGSADKPFRVGRTPKVRLVHQRTGEEMTASGYTIVIGRDPVLAQIVIRADDEKHVSGRHTEIQFRADRSIVVRDLGSRNGTWLNDNPLKGDAPLKVGDRLLLGNAPTVLVVAALDT